ncbi:integral membrane protein [Cordyceps fumosorosea ARSEF 2679]|uniref:Integral membrane protein n=1 Tax=Cordyceps fumosorosea (strain ARSEF 2679) TaxID=1081104 RepID=A0A168BTL8_CORFA|nr:integral membrane protein [Cordyceps fumosorosea ARSEF 2679]OAA70535.1 integral membrane protein [Cordyceps fumosorosea ARSEF 2679]
MVFVAHGSPELDEKSQYKMIIAVCVVMSGLASIIVGARLFIRKKNNRIAADDWMSILSLIFAIAYSVLCIVQTKYGLGLLPAIRPKENLIPYTRVNYAGRPIYQVGISFFKIALLISYLRLLQGTDNRRYRMVVWGAIAFVFLNHLGSALALIFNCNPIDKSWNPSKKGTCLPAVASFTAYAVLTIISDILVAVLPIPVLLKLNIRLEKKLGLMAIFALGLFTTLCSILRYTQINRIQYGDHDSTMLVVWGVIEFNVGNMVSSLPFLAPVCLRKARDYRSKHSKYAYGSNGNSKNRAAAGGIKGNEAYKLSDVSQDRSAFAGSQTHTSSSEENILQKNNAIMKSVTYSVRVEDDEEHMIGRAHSTNRI